VVGHQRALQQVLGEGHRSCGVTGQKRQGGDLSAGAEVIGHGPISFPALSEGREEDSERGVGDALREAIDRTLQATAGPAVAATRGRAGELVDELARRGREARGELARRGQAAGAELAKRGQDAGAELGRRLEALEQRLAEVEESLREETGRAERQDAGPSEPRSRVEGSAETQGTSKPKAEG
jgi:polyhydroxyalkanoate synthesis regulator phasin